MLNKMHAPGVSTSFWFLVKTYLWGLQMCMGEITAPSRSPLKTHPGLFSIIFCKCTCICVHLHALSILQTPTGTDPNVCLMKSKGRAYARVQGRHRTVQHFAAAGSGSHGRLLCSRSRWPYGTRWAQYGGDFSIFRLSFFPLGSTAED